MSRETPKKGDDITEESKLGTAVQKFVQKAEFSAFERIVCTHLIEAISGDELSSIIHITRAAMMLDEERCQLLNIDWQELIDLYTVSQRLRSAHKIIHRDEEEYYVNLDTLNFENQILPWIGEMRWYAFSYNYYFKEKVMIEMNASTREEAFDRANKRLQPWGYQAMVSDFLIYAVPKKEEINRKLSNIVSPATYQEILRLFKTPTVKVSSDE